MHGELPFGGDERCHWPTNVYSIKIVLDIISFPFVKVIDKIKIGCTALCSAERKTPTYSIDAFIVCKQSNDSDCRLNQSENNTVGQNRCAPADAHHSNFVTVRIDSRKKRLAPSSKTPQANAVAPIFFRLAFFAFERPLRRKSHHQSASN